MEFKNHDLVSQYDQDGVLYEERPLREPGGAEQKGLHTVWITLDNPAQYNSYTTTMVKGVILGMRRASNDRKCVAVVFTGNQIGNLLVAHGFGYALSRVKKKPNIAFDFNLQFRNCTKCFAA